MNSTGSTTAIPCFQLTNSWMQQLIMPQNFAITDTWLSGGKIAMFKGARYFSRSHAGSEVILVVPEKCFQSIFSYSVLECFRVMLGFLCVCLNDFELLIFHFL